jgi:hypothetical protein
MLGVVYEPFLECNAFRSNKPRTPGVQAPVSASAAAAAAGPASCGMRAAAKARRLSLHHMEPQRKFIILKKPRRRERNVRPPANRNIKSILKITRSGPSWHATQGVVRARGIHDGKHLDLGKLMQAVQSAHVTPSVAGLAAVYIDTN